MEDATKQISNLYDQFIPMIIEYGFNILGAIAIFIIGNLVAKWVARKTRKVAKEAGHVDDTLVPILANVVKIFIMAITILAVLNQFGVQTASLIAVLGAAGLAVGLALQGTLSNVAAGVMLLILRPFRVDDVVQVNGSILNVKEVGLFITKFCTFDNINVYMPNSSIWGNEIRNFNQNVNRRVDLTVGIGYGDDIDKALAITKEVVTSDIRVLTDPEPIFGVDSLGDSSVNLLVRAWVKTPDWFATKLDLTKAIKQRYDKESISIPFPQRDVHLYQAK